MITVAPCIIELYRKNYDVKNIELVTNSSFFKDVKPYFNIDDTIKVIHHGHCSSSRKLELLIETAKYCNDNIHFYLMLVVSRGYKNYYKKLRKMANGIKNVHFVDPVPTNKIVEMVNKYDIGNIFVPGSNLNLFYGLGNKFFEYIQARLMIITGPSLEMTSYIDKYQIGKYTKTFNPKELAELLNGLTKEEINNYKKNCDKYAYELSFEKQDKDKLKIIIEKLTNQLDNYRKNL